MSTTAIVMLIVAIVLVWGGLLLSIVNIRRSPEEVDELDPDYPEQPDEFGHPEPEERSRVGEPSR
ncbi:methionine/alanine import family NSS transporter small subunit [Kocuria sp. cx-455]|uniref:methionine/alanine import family NSS transporter small subunit n=1 Tax=Kocuria sp. cx-455 TaxID=2771377 RepID=UPI0016833C2E|nr:methionine/alanine import family NSS transporter small subunit [Kocuria sp. cx-455]MBD2764258.1 methionine/alanine import family NSS transporter small subunit [Kocuria sp. cx-455]